MNEVRTFINGVMHSKPIMRLVSVIDVMDFSVASVMKWTSVRGEGCSEVICGNYASLTSCKLCGGGLCDDCASMQ
jgi:hypothetical protein